MSPEVARCSRHIEALLTFVLGSAGACVLQLDDSDGRVLTMRNGEVVTVAKVGNCFTTTPAGARFLLELARDMARGSGWDLSAAERAAARRAATTIERAWRMVS